MDYIKMSFGDKITKSIIEKFIKKKIMKSFGVGVDVDLEGFNFEVVNGKVELERKVKVNAEEKNVLDRIRKFAKLT